MLAKPDAWVYHLGLHRPTSAGPTRKQPMRRIKKLLERLFRLPLPAVLA
jgi:hypothetical protein